MTEKQRGIFTHSLGLDHSDKSYRNYYDAGGEDPDCKELVVLGFMTKHKNHLNEMSESYIYSVTQKKQRIKSESFGAKQWLMILAASTL